MLVTSSCEPRESDDSEFDCTTHTTSSSDEPRYSCVFHPESNKFTWAISSRKGPSYARCTVCNRDVSVAYGVLKI